MDIKGSRAQLPIPKNYKPQVKNGSRVCVKNKLFIDVKCKDLV